MEIKKAIDSLEFLIDEDCTDTQYDHIEEIKYAIKALEKQNPIKPYKISKLDENDNAEVKCPVCCASNDYAIHSIKQGYCWKCGQKLDWSDEK